MNTDLVWIHPSQTVNEGSLAFTLNQMGIPTMVTESGAAFRIRYEYCRQIIDGNFFGDGRTWYLEGKGYEGQNKGYRLSTKTRFFI